MPAPWASLTRAELLRGLLSDGGVLAPMWADGHTTVNALWDAFARYPYLPRLKNLDTLFASVRQGANPIAWEIMGFALADALDPQTGRFVGLTTHGDEATVIGTTLVVRPDVAAAQLAEETARTTAAVPSRAARGASLTSATVTGPPPTTRFAASTRLPGSTPSDTNVTSRSSRPRSSPTSPDLLGTNIEISLEIKATNTDGFPDTSREPLPRTRAR